MPISGTLLAALLIAGQDPQSANGPPNVLFIAIDDLRTELGCYGVTDAQSPNLDRLADEGMLFTRHYVQAPTCGASRYALLTGRSPGKSGAGGNASLYQGPAALSQEQTEGAQSLPELFRRSGYHTTLIGKISHTPDGRVFAYDGSGDGREELPHAWDQYATPYGEWQRGWGSFFAYANGAHREDGEGHRDLMQIVVGNDESLPDGMMAQAAIEELAHAKERGKPFFMGLGFFKPHLPFVAPEDDWDALEQVRLRDARNPTQPTSKHWHRSNEFYGYNASFPLTRPLARKDRHLGESAIWGKHTPFERALRSTLIMRVPGVIEAGSVCEELVESIDLYPTLMELAATSFTKTEHPLDGQSLLSLLKGSEEPVREAAISYWRNAVSVRTESYRLITSGEGVERQVELYDMRTGPDPLLDLAPARPKQVQRMLGMIPEAR
ncbi:MAG: sulfatase-like hydrolase/transferase [Planctomycetota bacterium]|jgi:arylsulfatase A-like enzyme